jgi:hypothetical protein
LPLDFVGVDVGADFVVPDVVGAVVSLVAGWVGTVTGNVVGTFVVGVESSFARWATSQTRPTTPITASATPPAMPSLRCRSRCADRRRL